MACADDLLRRRLERLQAAAARSSTIILKPPPVPMPRTGGGWMVMMKASWIDESFWFSSPWMRCAVRPFASRSSNGSKRGEDRAGVRGVGEGGAVEAGERHGMLDALRLEDDLGRLLHHRVGARQRGAGRQLDDGDQIALVLLRDEAGRRAARTASRSAPISAGIDDEHHARRSGAAAASARHSRATGGRSRG